MHREYSRDPHAIVIVPTEAGVALRRAGRCGGTPPMVSRGRRGGWFSGRSAEESWADADEHGIPLVWDGELVPEGWDRARRVADHLRVAMVSQPFVDEIMKLARSLSSDGLCRVVLLDLVGGALVERAP